ncbi:MAG: STAS-like domain-containing protein [Muribaculaceae bacterium]|nr:STAS-like domain-containing protein [Muribaculaceae bacterium]
MIRITIANEVSLAQGVTPQEAQPISDRILASLKSGVPVVLDFAGMQLITTAFLNVVIGTLYKDFSSDDLKKLLSFDNLTDGIAMRIKRVTDNAKLFYENPEQFRQNVDSAIYGKD